jgi:tRNA(Ile2) C34 agmatinyltransferase TiaS
MSDFGEEVRCPLCKSTINGGKTAYKCVSCGYEYKKAFPVAETKDSVRLTLDMTQEMSDALTDSVKRSGMTKARYMRIAIELMNMLVIEKDCKIIIQKDGVSRELMIPGITRTRG